MNTAQMLALALVTPLLVTLLYPLLFAWRSRSALVALEWHMQRSNEMTEWDEMLSEERARSLACAALAAWCEGMAALATVDADIHAAEARAQALAAWGYGMAALAKVDAATELAAIHAGSLRALAVSSARIDAVADRARFALVARCALGFGVAYRDAA